MLSQTCIFFEETCFLLALEYTFIQRNSWHQFSSTRIN